MGRFGAKTPKRSRLWSNSRGIAAFRDPRPLTAAEKSRLGGHTLVRRHVDPGTGKRRFTGKRSSLKASGCLDYYTLHTDCIHGPCGLPRIVPSLQTATAAKAVPIPVWTTLRQGFSTIACRTSSGLPAGQIFLHIYVTKAPRN